MTSFGKHCEKQANGKPECSDFVEKSNEKNDSEKNEIFQFIREDIIGKDKSFTSPYGKRRIVFCDHIASSRALDSIESYIREYVLTSYGNTHTSTSATSAQSSMFQHEARTIIRNAVRANERDAVIFTGGGVTSAVHKLINGLDLDKPPVVFVGPYEHHSNLLPWRTIAVQVVQISEDASGHINMEHLELALKEWKGREFPMLGSFSAASNVTGVITDTVAVSSMLHKYGALSFWDYATGAPYLDIDMHPLYAENADKDAVFISMHKFLGGVDAPGLLIAKRSLLRNKTPGNAGGGTVLFVDQKQHCYLNDEEIREEGGTPRVVGTIRAGFAFQLKQTITVKTIMESEENFYKMALNEWKNYPNIHLLGNHQTHSENSERLSVFSFLIYHPKSKLYLHQNFVAALLNDVFGIQARGGCACAGPYSQHLLGIDDETTYEFEKVLLVDSRLDRVHLGRSEERSGYEVMRPGFVRINIPYFATLDEARYVFRAIAMVSEIGWHCLPAYKFKADSGDWWHTEHKASTNRVWLSNVTFTGKGLKIENTVKTTPAIYSYDELLQTAQDIFESSSKAKKTSPDHSTMFADDVAHLRWFLLPSEALAYLNGTISSPYPYKCIINIRREIKQLSTKEIKKQIKISPRLLKFQMEKVKSKKNPKYTDEASTDQKHSSQNKKISKPSSKDTCLKQEIKTSQASQLVKKSNSFHFVTPPKRLFKLSVQALEDFKMIEKGDRVLVCLSGGKDSISLLHVLHQYQSYKKAKGFFFEIGAVTVDPKTSSFDPSPLISYLKSLKVPYFYEKQDIMGPAARISPSSICAFTSRMKRGRMYACARREGWNVLAFGQHLDDLAETFLMSAFHNGQLRTMKAKYYVKQGDLKVIRPFAYIRETDTRHFAEEFDLPVIPENWPACFTAAKERHRVKQLLATQEILHPNLFSSLKEAIQPLLTDDNPETEVKNHKADPRKSWLDKILRIS